MKTDTQYPAEQNVAILIQGPPKSYKTTLLLQFPNPYIADCDDNLGGAVRYLRSLGKLKPFRYDTINRTDDGKEYPIELRWRRLIDNLNTAFADPWVKTVCVDGVTTCSDYLCAHIVKSKAASKEQEMTIGDWIPFRLMFSKLVTSAKTSGKVLVFTCHEQFLKEEDGSTLYAVNIPSDKLRACFSGFFTDYWRAEIRTTMKGSTLTNVLELRTTTTSPSKPFGNSLGLPPTWVFDHDDFCKRAGVKVD